MYFLSLSRRSDPFRIFFYQVWRMGYFKINYVFSQFQRAAVETFLLSLPPRLWITSDASIDSKWETLVLDDSVKSYNDCFSLSILRLLLFVCLMKTLWQYLDKCRPLRRWLATSKHQSLIPSFQSSWRIFVHHCLSSVKTYILVSSSSLNYKLSASEPFAWE